MSHPTYPPQSVAVSGRIFRLSTQTGFAVANARKALDHSLDFSSPNLQASIRGAGLEAVPAGYVWAFKDGLAVTNPLRAITAGDVALRITKSGTGERVVESLYEVLGYFPANPDIVTDNFAFAWDGPGPWPNSVLFGNRIMLPAPYPRPVPSL